MRDAPLTCLSSMATRTLLAALARDHELRTGHAVTLQAMGGVDAVKRVRAGEEADVIVLADAAMRALEAEGLVVAGSLAPVARSGMAVAVPDGAPLPDLADEAGLREALRAAGRVAYSTGPSGEHLLRLVAGWRLEEDMAGRLVQAPPGVPVATLLATGQADIGVQQLSELIGQAGIAIAGPLPADVQLATLFTAGVARASRSPAGAAALVATLASPEGAGAKLACGLEQP